VASPKENLANMNCPNCDLVDEEKYKCVITGSTGDVSCTIKDWVGCIAMQFDTKRKGSSFLESLD
jgi:hypothetical protein